ncbi:MAG: hypothetical protein KBE09_03345 [Candidatus Pacebacteria bacterium]|nr:hypothetical protein [Candidatus Paceibacterota bacterium]
MRREYKLPSDIPNVGNWIRRGIAIALLCAVALPVIEDKPWQRASDFWDKRVTPHVQSWTKPTTK